MSSFVERDLILRIIKHLAEVLARALALSAQQQHVLAEAELERGCTSLLGMELRALTLVDAASAADLLGDPQRVLVLARLLEGLADVARDANDAALERSRLLHALELVDELRRRAPQLAEAQVAHGRLSARVALSA